MQSGDQVLPSVRARGRGFSLIELMVVLGIAAILLSIGAPAFGNLLQSQRMTATVNDFMAAINLARSEAIQRGTRVDLVSAGDDWAAGWTVFVDADDNQRVDAGETVIFTHGPTPAGMNVTASMTDSSAQYLAYNGAGRTRTNASSQQPQFGTLTFKLSDQTRKIKINMLGRARVCNPATDGASC